MRGLPPCSWILDSALKVRLFGLLALPKNSTQNAGSKEKEAKELLCGMEAPAAVFGTVKEDALVQSFVGCAYVAVTASEMAARRRNPIMEI